MRAVFLATSTVEVAASLADKYGIFDGFNQHMCFADFSACLSGFARRSGAAQNRVDRWLTLAERLVPFGNACTPDSPRISATAACFEKLRAMSAAREGIGCLALASLLFQHCF